MPAVKTRVEPIERDIELLIEADLSPEAASAMLADVAREELARAQQINKQAMGSIPRHETFVDGHAGAAIESVRPDGTIIFEFEILLDLFAWIGEQLVQHSPVLTGRYQDSHQFYADGVAVDPGAVVPEAREYVFVNLQPYARKIERGLSPQAPDGVYHAVAMLASRRFGNVAKVSFGYRTPLSGGIHEWAKSSRMVVRRNPKNRDEWLRRQPAIIITLGK